MREITYSRIILSTQGALFGSVTNNLRAVKVEFGNNFITLNFYYDKIPSEFEDETSEIVGTEVISDFGDILFKALTDFRVKKKHLPYPNKIPDQGVWVYYRHEPTLKDQYDFETPKELMEEMSTKLLQVRVRISVQKALLGRITENLRAVQVECSNELVFLHFYYNEQPTEVDIKLAEEATKEISTIFSNEVKKFKNETVHIPYPDKVPSREYWIFFRYEPNPEEDSI